MRPLGWIPDVPDHRDYDYTQVFGEERWLSPRTWLPVWARFSGFVDLTDNGRSALWPKIYDQGELAAPSTHAVAAVVAYGLARQGVARAQRELSRLTVYWLARAGIPFDVGDGIRTTIKALAGNTGAVTSEVEWPYDLLQWAQDPPHASPERFARAPWFKLTYARLTRLDEMLHCLDSGHPFIFGLPAYPEALDSLSKREATLRRPHGSERPRGGQVWTGVGYSLLSRRFLIRGSWGEGLGDDGYFWIDASHALELGRDFWTVRAIHTPVKELAP